MRSPGSIEPGTGVQQCADLLDDNARWTKTALFAIKENHQAQEATGVNY